MHGGTIECIHHRNSSRSVNGGLFVQNSDLQQQHKKDISFPFGYRPGEERGGKGTMRMVQSVRRNRGSEQGERRAALTAGMFHLVCLQPLEYINQRTAIV